jgi:uncharacterized protein YodC (DUF2158 family)
MRKGLVPVSLLLSTAVHGQITQAPLKSGGPAMTEGGGIMYCSTFNALRSMQRGFFERGLIDGQMFAWAQGYMSAMNSDRASRGLPAKNLAAIDASKQEVMIVQYCAEYPNDQVFKGINKMFYALPECVGCSN